MAIAKRLPPKAPELPPARTLSSANVNKQNPRRIGDDELKQLRDSLKRFGDLSGIILNTTTNQLVGGHQRIEAFQQDKIPVTVTEKLETPDRTGTVAYGYIQLNGTRYTYREVEWTEQQERIANIAANKMGGDWDLELLAGVLRSVKLDGAVDALDQTGFSDNDLTQLLADIDRKLPTTSSGIDISPRIGDDEFSLFELIMRHENKTKFIELLDKIRKEQEVATLEDAIMYMVDAYQG